MSILNVIRSGVVLTLLIVLSGCGGAGGDGGITGSTDNFSMQPSPITISATNPANYNWGTLTSGADVYIDRAYTYTTIPVAYEGYQALKTANDDKASTGNSFISFNIDQAATIYVAYTEGANLPGWLSSWTPTGDSLSTTDRTLLVYSQNFTAGTVTLGGNESAPSMYTVIIESSTGAPSPPSVNLSASPSSVEYNGLTTLNWNSSNTTGCTASGGWSGSMATSGSQTISGLITDSSFNLTCNGPGGTANDSASVAVIDPLAPMVNLSVSASVVSENGSTTLSWTSSNVDTCTASGDWSGIMPTSGSQVISALTTNSTFELSCSGANGTTTDSVNVRVFSVPSGWAPCGGASDKLWSWAWAGENGENVITTPVQVAKGKAQGITDMYDLSGNGHHYYNHGTKGFPGYREGLIIDGYAAPFPTIAVDGFEEGNYYQQYLNQNGTMIVNDFYLAFAGMNTRIHGVRDIWGSSLSNQVWLQQNDDYDRLGIVIGGSEHTITNKQAVPKGPVLIEVWRDTSNTIHAWVNGEDVSIPDITNSNIFSMSGILWDGDGDDYWDDYAFEFIACDSLPTSSQRDQVREYLRSKWKLY